MEHSLGRRTFSLVQTKTIDVRFVGGWLPSRAEET
jgi:hypothetical protein